MKKVDSPIQEKALEQVKAYSDFVCEGLLVNYELYCGG